MVKKFLYFWFCCLSSSLFGQFSKPYFDQVSDVYGYVYTIHQDQKGYLWVGTKAGLHCYDGHTFRTIQDPDSLLIANNNYVQSILEDQHHRLWLGSRKGLYILNEDRKLETFFRQGENQLSHDEIRKVEEQSSKDQFWIGTYGGGVTVYHEPSQSFRYLIHDSLDRKSLPNNRVNDLKIDRKGRIWVGCEVGGLALYNSKENNFIHVPLETQEQKYTVSAIAEDIEGNIWVGTWSKGLFKYDEKTKELVQVWRATGEDNPKNTIRRILPDTNQILYLATLNGLAIYQSIDQKIEFHAHDPKIEGTISGNIVWSIYKDNEGILWLGTIKNGLCQWDPTAHQFSTLNIQDSFEFGLQNDAISAMYYTSSQDLWVATTEGSVHCLSTQDWTYRDNSALKPMMGKGIQDMTQDTYGHIWLVSDFGVFRYTPSTQILDTYEKSNFTIDGQEMGGTYSCTIGQNGDFYIAGWGTGLMVLPKEKQNQVVLSATDFIHYTTKNSAITTNILWQVLNDQQGNIWMNSKKGVFIFSEGLQKIKPLMQDELSLALFLNKNQVYGFDPLGKIYALSDHDPPKVSKHFYNNRLEMCQIDSKGNLWTSSPSELLITKMSSNEKTLKFTTAHGLPKDPIRKTLFLSDKELVVLGTSKGLVLKPYHSLTKNEYTSHVVLQDIKLFGKSIKPNKEYTSSLTFQHDENALEFWLSPMALSRTSAVHIRYKLSSEKHWHQISKYHPVAMYPKLPSGEYELLVKTVNANGFTSPTQSVVKFQILNPWWKTWWAIFLYILVGIIILRIAFTYSLVSIKARNQLKMEAFEVEQQEKLIQDKLQFFTNISHEIKTPLTLILGPIEQLLEQDNSTDITSKLAIVKRNAEHLHRLFEELLEFRKIESGILPIDEQKIEFRGFIQQVLAHYTALAEMRSIEIIESYPTAADTHVYIDSAKMEKVIHNLLSNAFHHTPESGKIYVSLNVDEINSFVHLSIEDTGQGIAKELKEHIFDRFVSGSTSNKGTGIGLALVKQIILLHQGFINAENTSKGAKFTVDLPLDLVHEFDKNRTATDLKSVSTKETILLVEDNLEIQQFMISLLEDQYVVDIANNGKEGLEIAQSTPPNLIISDVMMPEMNGFELCQHLKEDINLCHIPIILLTARSSDEDVIQGLQYRADEYVTKPFNSTVLLLKINNILSAKRDWKNKFQVETSTKFDTTTIESLDEKLLRSVIELINAHMTDPQLNVAYLSTELGLHRSNLSKKLKGLTGFSPVEFIRHIRLKKAYELLQSGKFNISEIAYEVGYNNPKYFSTSFKNQFGISPSDITKASN